MLVRKAAIMLALCKYMCMHNTEVSCKKLVTINIITEFLDIIHRPAFFMDNVQKSIVVATSSLVFPAARPPLGNGSSRSLMGDQEELHK